MTFFLCCPDPVAETDSEEDSDGQDQDDRPARFTRSQKQRMKEQKWLEEGVQKNKSAGEKRKIIERKRKTTEKQVRFPS